MNYSSWQTLLDSTNSNVSSHSSNNAFVGDAVAFSLSITTSTTALSRFTVLGSNQNGLTSALSTPQLYTVNNGQWSIITTITSNGLFVFDTGYRWISVGRALDWGTTVFLNQQVSI